ncbi:hypothetical protein DICSQDRAFT_130638, partial [Dichomitus squalens LYAD-421 SS1]
DFGQERNPWRIDPSTGELPWEELPTTEVNLENRLYCRLFELCQQSQTRNQIPNQPQIDLIEPFEADQLDSDKVWQPKITKDEESFLLRSVLIKVNGKYREGHGILHMVYFPHKSERVRVAEDEEYRLSSGNGSETSSELSEEDNAVTQYRRQWPRMTMHDLNQSMAEMGFELRKSHTTGPDAKMSKETELRT